MSSTTDTRLVQAGSESRNVSALDAARRQFEDGRLSRQAASGSRTAFARIYERHHQELWRYSLSLLRNEEDAKDALQSTFERALAAMPQRRSHGSLRPWLFRIVHNESISVVRRRRSHQDLEELSVPALSDVEREVGTRTELEQLVRDLEQLSEQERGALLMREASGLEYDAIAEALQISPAAAKQSVYAARTSLREYEHGRTMQCEAVRSTLFGEDRRALRGRRLQAHLRGCEDCRGFRDAVRVRRRRLLALAPPLDWVAAAGVLGAVLDGTNGGGGAAAGGIGSGSAVASSVAAKSAIAIVAAVVVTGAGTAVTRLAGSADAPPAQGEETSGLPMPGQAATPLDAGAGPGRRGDRGADPGGRPAPADGGSASEAGGSSGPTSEGTQGPSGADDGPRAGSAPGSDGPSAVDLAPVRTPAGTEGEARSPVDLPTPGELLGRLPEVPGVSVPTVEAPSLPSTPTLPEVSEVPVALPVPLAAESGGESP